MLEMDLLLEAFRQRRERIEESGPDGERSKKNRASPKARMQETSDMEVAQRALNLIEKAPDVRRDRVEEIKKGLKKGNLKFDSKSIADRLLQESILNELL